MPRSHSWRGADTCSLGLAPHPGRSHRYILVGVSPRHHVAADFPFLTSMAPLSLISQHSEGMEERVSGKYAELVRRKRGAGRSSLPSAVCGLACLPGGCAWAGSLGGTCGGFRELWEGTPLAGGHVSPCCWGGIAWNRQGCCSGHWDPWDLNPAPAPANQVPVSKLDLSFPIQSWKS